MIIDFNSERKNVNKNTVGQKFYNLYLLKNELDQPVPEAFCLTDRHYDRNELAARINDSIKYAVRSSSNQEDKKDGSAAGLFSSYLNIKGLKQIEESVGKCFDSVSGPEIRKYLQKKGEPQTPVHVSVIIQEMVEPEEAGVLFTINPVNGSDEYVIESVSGLAEQILEGSGKPERYCFDKTAIPEYPVYALLREHAVKIEKYFGQPQDIEWAYRQKKIYILQTRPVTGQFASQDMTIRWTRANIGEILPFPLTPLSWDVFEKVIFSSYRFGFYAWHDRLLMNLVHLIPREWPKVKSPRLFQGYAYLDHETIRLTFSFEPWVDDEVLNIGLGFNISAANRNRQVKTTTKLIRWIKKITFLFEMLIPWFSFERRGVTYVTKQLVRKPAKNLDQLLKKASFAFGWHIAATARSFATLGYLKHKLASGFSPQKISEELARIKNHQFLTDLDRLIKTVKSDPALRAKIGRSNLNDYRNWEKTEHFIAQFDSFLDAYGHRSDNEFELAQKSWQDSPSLLKPVLLGGDKQRLQNSSEVDRTARIYTKLASAFNLREDLKNILVREFRNLRAYFLDQEERLVRQGLLNHREDIFFLHLDEIESSEDLDAQEIKNSIEKRKIDHNLSAQNQVPYAFNGDQWYNRGDRRDSPKPELITGIGCSAGKISARCVHIRSVDEDTKLTDGDILIANATNPGWTPMFARAGGVITEIGGMLSHTATIAREYEIPMITGIENIFDVIPDGCHVTIDGGLGTVRLLKN